MGSDAGGSETDLATKHAGDCVHGGSCHVPTPLVRLVQLPREDRDQEHDPARSQRTLDHSQFIASRV